MQREGPREDLLVLQRDPRRIRNLCILAHVDHGKTSLADSLLASNGIISQRMAGKLRYMDDRPDEQERGITMKASAILLKHSLPGEGDFLINLIDSPGHVDFSGEVSTAVRVCDGALVVVDAVEGCAAQTVQVLRQAWLENIRPLLIINKLDRLILEHKLSPSEAYQRLLHVLEEVNAVMGSLFASDTMKKTELKREKERRSTPDEDNPENGDIVYDDWDAGLEDSDDSALYFQPEKGNVVFASALDGWGFTIDRFAEIYAQKLGLSRRVLNLTLWGDFWLNVKEKKVHKGARNRGKKPLFVQFVLDNLWQMYDAICIKKDKEMTEKIVTALGLKVHARDMRVEPRSLIFVLCSQWLPLGKAILDAVCRHLPSPAEIIEERVESLLANQQPFRALPDASQALKPAFLACSAEPSAPVIAFVSKVFAVQSKHLLQSVTAGPTRGQALSLEEIAARREAVRQRREMTEHEGIPMEDPVEKPSEQNSEEMVFLAFARVFSGSLREGDEVFVLGPKYQVENGEGDGPLPPYASRVRLGAVYCMMGREMQKLPVACAGNVVGIAGLEGVMIRSGTLSSTLACPAFTDLYTTSMPIVRVAVEPKRTTDLAKLVEGLKLLNQADPCVEVLLQDTGEHVLITAGEVHLQRCVRDLQDTYAKVEINVSPPIVPFRETIIPGAKTDGTVEMETLDRTCRMKIRAVPLPEAATRLLEENGEVLKRLHEHRKTIRRGKTVVADEKVDRFKGKLEEALKVSGISLDSICCFGPRHSGPNVLINASDTSLPSVWSVEEAAAGVIEHLATGFNLATLAGPLCEEPMMGVGFVIEELQIEKGEAERAAGGSTVGGQLISSMKDACRRAFQAQPQRLMLAMYFCVIQATSDVLGKVYSVVSRRHGRVLKDEMLEGSDLFSIATVLPVVESFGLAEEMRKRSSGLALPQLTFSHWETLEVDPFWTPGGEMASADDYELYGDKADAENLAMKYVRLVRRRKGLFSEEQVVVSGEKQRTVKKNK